MRKVRILSRHCQAKKQLYFSFFSTNHNKQQEKKFPSNTNNARSERRARPKNTYKMKEKIIFFEHFYWIIKKNHHICG